MGGGGVWGIPAFASDLHGGGGSRQRPVSEKTQTPPPTPIPIARFLFVPAASPCLSVSVGSLEVGAGGLGRIKCHLVLAVALCLYCPPSRGLQPLEGWSAACVPCSSHTGAGSFSSGSPAPSWTEPRALPGMKGCGGPLLDRGKGQTVRWPPRPKQPPLGQARVGSSCLHWALRGPTGGCVLWALSGEGSPPASASQPSGGGFPIEISPKLSCWGETNCSDPESRPTHPSIPPSIHSGGLSLAPDSSPIQRG